MSEKLSSNPEPRGLDRRAGNSRKLLSRKARGKGHALSGAPIEDSFPTAIASLGLVPALANGETGTLGLCAPLGSEAVAQVTPRYDLKASPKLRPGDISPNPGTLVAAIVRLVVERGEVSRADLIELMSGTGFSHPKARPAEKGWSRGYIAGAIRSGVLAVAVGSPPNDDVAAPDEGGEPC